MNERDLITKSVKYELSTEPSGNSNTLSELLDVYCGVRKHFKVSLPYSSNLFDLSNFDNYAKREKEIHRWLEDMEIIYFITGNQIFFLNEEDAAAFKLKFTR